MCFFVVAQIVPDLVGGSLFKLQTVLLPCFHHSLSTS